ncbi:MAG TPA: Asp-tRNA(Asn)/Glu-tRNA(Gln) amidotransferase subunit GatB [Clostridiales bacterium]|nr:Asp-tRNA(Asn)/Glu-tRNA(Gln) amidotransferase subunit GatB [Clostridiales bacterium]
MSKYNLVVGFETHVELKTKTKIFCSCANEFGGEPNTNCCPICLGEPGTLPQLNKEVVKYAIKAGLSLNCKIPQEMSMDRKHYFYPDLGKSYQTTQSSRPICLEGYLTLDSGKKIRINHIHIEEDASKLVHDSKNIYIDNNRGSTPLIEIVTEPDISSVEEAREYIEKLQAILRHIDVSDCKMQEGSMRCDVNISVHKEGEPLGTRTEIKNMNSISFIEKAISYEYDRHVDLIENGQKDQIIQETRRYDEKTDSTESMREKEDAQDYRYFPDPNFFVLKIEPSFVENLRKMLPKLPSEIKAELIEDGIDEKAADLLTKYKNVSDFYLEAKKYGDNKIIATYILGEIFRSMETEEEKENFDIKITAEDLGKLSLLQKENKITAHIAYSILPKMLKEGRPHTAYLTKEDLVSVDNTEVDKLCKEAVDAMPQAVKDYKAGKEKAIKAVVGYVMRATKGKANPSYTEQKILELIQ